MASLIRPEKTQVKWHNFAARSLVLSPMPLNEEEEGLLAAGVTRSAGVQSDRSLY
jgi:hypothetical protein